MVLWSHLAVSPNRSQMIPSSVPLRDQIPTSLLIFIVSAITSHHSTTPTLSHYDTISLRLTEDRRACQISRFVLSSDPITAPRSCRTNRVKDQDAHAAALMRSSHPFTTPLLRRFCDHLGPPCCDASIPQYPMTTHWCTVFLFLMLPRHSPELL